MQLEPVSVALKFGFLAVLYLFLVWVAVSALRDSPTASGAGFCEGPSQAIANAAAKPNIVNAFNRFMAGPFISGLIGRRRAEATTVPKSGALGIGPIRRAPDPWQCARARDWALASRA